MAAARLGADGVELDVRRGADGALVVHHDAVLPDGRAISNVSTSEIPAEVPLLDAALDACAGLLVNIEVKNAPNEADWDPAESIARAIARLVVDRGAQSHVIVSAFSLASIDAVRDEAPTVPTGWLTLPGYDQLGALESVVERGHHAVHPHHSAVNPELVDAAHGAGLRLYTWTVDDPERIAELADWGVDGVITNVPDVALAALGRS